MKYIKLVLLLLPLSLISQVKKEDIPKFKDKKINEYVQLYLNVSKTYIKNNGNFFKDNLIARSQELGKKGKEVMPKLTPGQAKRFSDFADVFEKEMLRLDAYKATKEKEDFTKLTGIKTPEFDCAEANQYVKYYVFYADEYIRKKGKLSEEGIEIAKELVKNSNKFDSNLTKKELKEITAFFNLVNKKMKDSLND